MANLDWLVVRDLYMIESATFWKDGPEIETGEIVPSDCRTEVFFLPAASHVEKEGTFTKTQRLLQWREKAVEPPGDCRSELWFFYHLGRQHQGAAGRLDRRARPPAARPGLGLPHPRRAGRAERRGGAAGDQRLRRGDRPAAVRRSPRLPRRLHRRRLLDLHRGLRRRGQPGGPAQARQRAGPGRRRSGAGPGRPTGASSTTAPPPTRRAGRGASARPTSGGTRRGRVDRARRAGLRDDQAAGLPAARRTPPGRRHLPATTRSSCRPTGRAGCSRPAGLSTARCPRTTSRPSHRSQPALRPAGQPGTQGLRAARQPAQPEPAGAAQRGLPVRVHHVSRLTEHHTAGGMSRYAALPLGAAAGDVRRGLPGARRPSAAWTTWAGPRSSPPAPRSRRGCWSPTGSRRCASRAGWCTRSGCRTTGAASGLTTGDSANDLFGITLDPNV